MLLYISQKKTLEFLKENKITFLDWPPQSPDLNPIENIWHYVKDRLRKKKITSKENLWEEIKKEWKLVTPSLCKKLVEGIPKRLNSVLLQKGNSTKY